jgi:hypothetical protein
MSLEGSLDSFGLPDVLSLLAMTGKTGTLRLSRAEVPLTGSVTLREGVIVAACADDRANTLARRFIAAGLIDAAAVTVALADSRSALAESLATAGNVDAETAGQVAQEQVLDAVFELLRWPSGHFAFALDEPAVALTDAHVTALDAIAEAQQRLAGWPELTQRLPGPETVLTLALGPAVQDAPSCSAQEWSALALLDGHRTLAEAVALSEHGEWRTLNVFAGLVERALVVSRDDHNSVNHRAGLINRLTGEAAEVVAAPVAPVAAPAPIAVQAEASLSELAGLAADSLAVDHIRAGMPVASSPTDEVAHSGAAVEARGPAFESPVPAFESPVPAFDSPVAASQPTRVADVMAEVTTKGVYEGVESVVPAGDGVDDALLQRLIAGVRAL